MAAVNHLIEEGVAKLLEARGSPAGAAQEKTLLSALQFLYTALETDVWLLQELRQHPATGKALSVMIGDIIVVIMCCTAGSCKS